MGLLTKSELDIFEEIIECPKCLKSENICNYHAELIKTILVKDVKIRIKELSAAK